MRVKITFAKGVSDKKSKDKEKDSVPIHHQRHLSSLFHELMKGETQDSFCFSSLKGTSKVMGGQIVFLSTKVTVVISAPTQDFVEGILRKVFEKNEIKIDNFSMIPKAYQLISEPKFKTENRYICLSPVVISPSTHEEPQNVLDPASQEFSDLVFDSLMTRMEDAGYTDEQLNQYAQFEITPDPGYMKKIGNSPKKYARTYKNDKDENMTGYLFPFIIHAHAEIHKFIWQRGIGLFTTEGYGFLDTVPETPPATDFITP
jgi:CRISPR-associated endoribonuclease Cas6